MSAVLRNLITLSALIAVAALLAACGGSGNKPAYCQDKAALKSSISDLKKVDLSVSNLGAVRTDLNQVKGAANNLVASAKKDFGPQADALKTAVATLGTAVQTAASSPSGQSLATVAAGLSGVNSAYNQLSDAVSSKC